MGGFGSGPVLGWNNRDTVEDYRSIDVRRWSREGRFSGHHSFGWQWTIDGEKVASIHVHSYPDRVILIYRNRQYGGEWEDIRTPIWLERTPCHFGGHRVWFACPRCRRLVAKLYGGKYFWCRHCHQLPYRSQSESKLDQAMRRANYFFDQIRGDDRTWLIKPKGMHWKTYWRLYSKGIEQQRKAKTIASWKWGSWGADLVEDCTPIAPYEIGTKGEKPNWD